MSIIALDCDSIRVTDINPLVAGNTVICVANALTKLPMNGTKRVGIVAPKATNLTDFVLISLLTAQLVCHPEGQTVKLVSRDKYLIMAAEFVCNTYDAELQQLRTIYQLGIDKPMDVVNRERKRALFIRQQKMKAVALFITQTTVSLKELKSRLSINTPTLNRVVGELVNDGVICKHGKNRYLYLGANT